VNANAWALLACSSALSCAPPDFRSIDPTLARETFAEPVANARVNFTGTYVSPESGTLLLWQDGQQLDGSYQLFDCEYQIRGSLAGVVRGNRAEVRWSETQRLLTPPTPRTQNIFPALTGMPVAPEDTGYIPKRYASDGYFYFNDDPAYGPAHLFGEQQYVTPLPGSANSGPRETHGHSNVWTATRITSRLILPITSLLTDCPAEASP